MTQEPACAEFDSIEMERFLRRKNNFYVPTLENVLLFYHDSPHGVLSRTLSGYHDDRKHSINIERAFRKHLETAQLPVRVLEIGCFFGLRCFVLNTGLPPEKRQSVEFVGLDINPSSISWAQQFRHIHQANSNCRFVVSDLERGLDFDEQTFDIVICSEVVEHMTDPGEAFREIYRVLKSGGLAIVTTPNKDSFPERIARAIDRAVFGGRLSRTHYGSSAELSGDGDMVMHGMTGHGHISEKGAGQWSTLARESNFEILAVRNGAILPASPLLEKHPWIFALALLGECILERLPSLGHPCHRIQLDLRKPAKKKR